MSTPDAAEVAGSDAAAHALVAPTAVGPDCRQIDSVRQVAFGAVQRQGLAVADGRRHTGPGWEAAAGQVERPDRRAEQPRQQIGFVVPPQPLLEARSRRRRRLGDRRLPGGVEQACSSRRWFRRWCLGQQDGRRGQAQQDGHDARREETPSVSVERRFHAGSESKAGARPSLLRKSAVFSRFSRLRTGSSCAIARGCVDPRSHAILISRTGLGQRPSVDAISGARAVLPETAIQLRARQRELLGGAPIVPRHLWGCALGLAECRPPARRRRRSLLLPLALVHKKPTDEHRSNALTAGVGGGRRASETTQCARHRSA